MSERGPWFDALRELAEAGRAYREMPPPITAHGGHYETDEISCVCGFVSQAAEYGTARRSLANHINRKISAALHERDAIIKRFDAALSRVENSQAQATE